MDNTLNEIDATADAHTGEEFVVEGIILPRRKNEIIISWTGLITTMIFLTMSVTAVFLLVEFTDTLEVKKHPSLSPTSTLLPSQIFDYRAHLREIVKDVSDPNLLDDPTSDQSLCLDVLAQNMQRLVNSSILDPNDEEKIIERYAAIVTILSLSAHGLETYIKYTEPGFGHTCSLPSLICDEDEHIVGIVVQNGKTTASGGGSLAMEISALRSLTHIIITRCAINGPIPKELRELKQLKVLDLRMNSFSGQIPKEIGELQNLQLMFLNDNNFEKKIPSEIGNASSLIQIDLSHNNLSGEIPTQLGSLRNLNAISFQGNNLRGSAGFLCENSFATNSSSQIAYTDDFEKFLYSINLGVHIDCNTDIQGIDCDCCECIG